MALVPERTIAAELPLLVGKVSDVAWSAQRIPYGRNLGFLDRMWNVFLWELCSDL
jgi:hypothetical protein